VTLEAQCCISATALAAPYAAPKAHFNAGRSRSYRFICSIRAGSLRAAASPLGFILLDTGEDNALCGVDLIEAIELPAQAAAAGASHSVSSTMRSWCLRRLQ
jgi:hypothetical protein